MDKEKLEKFKVYLEAKVGFKREKRNLGESIAYSFVYIFHFYLYALPKFHDQISSQ